MQRTEPIYLQGCKGYLAPLSFTVSLLASSVEHLTISRSSTTFLPDRRLKNRANPQNKGGDLDATVTSKLPYSYSDAQTPYP